MVGLETTALSPESFGAEWSLGTGDGAFFGAFAAVGEVDGAQKDVSVAGGIFENGFIFVDLWFPAGACPAAGSGAVRRWRSFGCFGLRGRKRDDLLVFFYPGPSRS